MPVVNLKTTRARKNMKLEKEMIFTLEATKSVEN
jgi:hypothetical protein